MKLVSWNVNGVRACVNKGMTDWVKDFAPDILGIQETKAQFDQYPQKLMELDYHVLHTSAQKKGYSGVALFSKEKPLSTQEGIGVSEYDEEGRNLIAEFENFYVFNSYYPNGQRDHSRVEFKLGFYEAILKKANKLKKKKPVILMGDFNTAHHGIDLANPKGNKKTTGFLPHEREWLDKLIDHGFIDIHRELNKNKDGEYTWWTYRNNCRERNIGWRIDYFFVDQAIQSKVSSSKVLKEVMGSDHCPIFIEVDQS